MPARPPVPGVCKAELTWLVGTKAGANVLHFSYTPATPAPLAYVQALATALADIVLGNAGLFGPDVSFTGCTVTDLSSDTGFVAVSSGTAPGTRDGDPLPANAAVLASYTIARRYRGGHPRQYLPWFTVADILNPQEWVAESVAGATTAWTNVIGGGLSASGGGVSTLAQVMVSYILADVERVTPLVNPISFSHCDQVIASQRRRDGRH